MKKIIRTFLYSATLTLIVPASSFAATKLQVIEKYPLVKQKSCALRYEQEVSAINKMVDRNKANKKIAELKKVRKEQDKTIDEAFDSLSQKADTEEARRAVDEYEARVNEALDAKREKIIALQAATILSEKEVSTLVNKNLIELDVDENLCPINPGNAKEVRAINTASLKRLAEEKKQVYQMKTSQIQSEFVDVVTDALAGISALVKE